MATILILYYRAVLLHRPHFIYVILHAPAPQHAKKHPFGCFFAFLVPVHAPSFASMASQTSSMSPTMP